MTVVMKIDLVGPERRGLALGLNESAGYGGVALAAAGQRLAGRRIRRPRRAGRRWGGDRARRPLISGSSSATPLPTSHSSRPATTRPTRAPRLRERLSRRLLSRPRASLLLAGRPGQQPERRAGLGARAAVSRRRGRSIGEIGLVAGIYPAVWGLGQIWTGHWSDSVGRKPLIVAGMLIQAAALTLLAVSDGRIGRRGRGGRPRGGHGARLPDADRRRLRCGRPVARAPAVGVYRFWRDMGYVAGGLIAGVARRRDRLQWRDRDRCRPHRRCRAVGGVRPARPARERPRFPLCRSTQSPRHERPSDPQRRPIRERALVQRPSRRLSSVGPRRG